MAAVELLQQALSGSTNGSVLLRHEICYVLGQIGEASAIPQLRQVVADDAEDDIVRHEAVESLAALHDTAAVSLLQELVARPNISDTLRHTSELALAGLEKRSAANAVEVPICACQFNSADPAKGWVNATEEDLPAAAGVLGDVQRALYERYEALFTLRNVGGAAAAAALSQMLSVDTSSAVLRHEVAFVLGQMEEERALDALGARLACSEEHPMVRHEAAIALGAVGTAEADAVLLSHVGDSERLVAESCRVALHTSAYWRAWEEAEARIKAH
eukprot:gnl/TRDRNA2_/TRDRNA2_133893_c1_seq1.p1 gnl/TRDRNA2_/TRDRNA2_133893_c1~~gnl/TRDRNA2_/TRDRNA2_133893_c1_seq1.p1  ORF type:complete len:303 (-),score=67.37 gnl/TRDRNA2_/TRDRNA2_133893_c1_seq1:75-896(-)